ncbi:MAG: hypothetical protein IKH26_03320 [Bacteroidaceae bacterium]|nr:hypothetical protein [Bacteroidaceae bacterium]
MKNFINSNIIIVLAMAVIATSCGQKKEQSANNNNKVDSLMSAGEDFDISKYLEQMEDNPELRFGIGEYQVKEYALADIDGDNKNEVWVRDTTFHYEAIYVVDGDSVHLVAYADGCTELTFYKNAVAYNAYYTPGRSCQGAQMLKDSKLTEYYFSEVQWNIFSEEQEVTDEMYYINNKSATSEECEKFVEKLGEPVEEPELKWQPITMG